MKVDAEGEAAGLLLDHRVTKSSVSSSSLSTLRAFSTSVVSSKELSSV